MINGIDHQLEGHQKMLARYLYYLEELRRDLHLEPSKLEQIQEKRLRLMLKHAYEHVPFYHRRFNEASIKPEDIRTSDDLAKIPATSKAEIQAASLQDTTADNVDSSKSVKGTTSGSTGVPLTITIDEKSEDFRLALLARAYVENGLKLWDKMAIIKDPRHFTNSKSWLTRLGIIRRKEISIFDDPATQLATLETYKPGILKGYSSSLAILANFGEGRNRSFHPRAIFAGAELLFDAERKRIGSVFDCDVLDFYGSTEFSLLAWECSHHEGYHMNIEGTKIEFVKEGEVVGFGEEGEIVCTSLVNYAMPLIRYKLGDEGTAIDGRCSCGRSLPLLKMLQGRTDDFLTALDGRIIPPTVFSPYPFSNLEKIKQFRVIQEKRDRLTIQLVVDQSFLVNHQILEKAEEEIKRVFGQDMQVDFQILENIEKDATGKLRKIVSLLPSSR